MEMLKNILFDAVGVLGVSVLIVALAWELLEFINRIFRFSKMLIMLSEYKRNDGLYNLKDKLVVSKDGKISYTAAGGLDEQIDILRKAETNLIELKKIQQKYSL